MKKVILLSCLLLASILSQAQKLDSLLGKLSHAKSDSLKAAILYQIGLNHTDIDSAIWYFKNAITLETTTKNHLGLANSNHAIGLKKLKKNELDSALFYWKLAAAFFQKSYANHDEKTLMTYLPIAIIALG